MKSVGIDQHRSIPTDFILRNVHKICLLILKMPNGIKSLVVKVELVYLTLMKDFTIVIEIKLNMYFFEQIYNELFEAKY